MSYILDALRRAEAERERGAVPSLASQRHSIETEEDEAPERSRLLVWAVIGLAFALIATLAWTFLGGPGAPGRQIADVPVTPAPVAPPAPVPQSLAEIAATPSPSMPPPPPMTIPSPSPSRSPSQMQIAPAQPTPRPVAAPVVRAAPHVALAAPKAVTPAVPAAASASEPRIYAQSELPEDIRRELPRVAINGSSYSGDATSRMVMINGQVFHEGDPLGAGLVLDKIRRRSAVFSYKGFRYEVMF